MSETLVIAIVGQCVTLLIVLIQQIFNSKNLRKQASLNYKNEFYKNKVEAYKKLILKLNIDLNVNEITTEYFDFFYKEVYFYSSQQVIDLFYEFYNMYLNYSEQKNKQSKNSMELLSALGYKAGEMHQIVREEIKNFE